MGLRHLRGNEIGRGVGSGSGEVEVDAEFVDFLGGQREDLGELVVLTKGLDGLVDECRTRYGEGEPEI